MPFIPSAVAAGGVAAASGITLVAYAENTGLNLTITGSEQTCGVDVTFTSDGVSPYRIEFFAPILAIFTGGDTIQLILRENPTGANTARGELAQYTAGGAAQWAVFGRRVITPAAGSVTYRVNVIRNAGGGSPSIQGGTGAAGTYVAASLAVFSA